MAVEITSRAVKASQSKGVARIVLLCLAWHANGETGLAWPSLGTMAEWANCSRRAAHYALRGLVKSGEIEVETQGGGRAKSTRYRVSVGMGDWSERVQELHRLEAERVQSLQGLEADTVQDLHRLEENSAESAPLKGCNPCTVSPERVQSATLKGAKSAPEPLRKANADASACAHEKKGEGSEVEKKVDHRQRLLSAMGCDPISGLNGHGAQMLGRAVDMLEVDKWFAAGLSEIEQLAIVREVVKKRPDGWKPGSFVYFSNAMSDFAAAKARKLPAPRQSGEHRKPHTVDFGAARAEREEFIKKLRAGDSQ